MSVETATAAIEALGDLVREYQRRTDELIELFDIRFAALEDRLAKLDKQPNARGARREALTKANERRAAQVPSRPRLALAIAERNSEKLIWADDL